MQELLRRLAEQVVNAVMDAEADQLCGGGANSRNGYRERALATCVGTLALRIPKLRSGSFFPEDVLERYQRVDRALVAAVAEMYATGTARARLRRAQGGPRAHGRRRHRQDAHGVGPLRAGVREEARGALLHGVLARDAPEARPRQREARPGGRAHRQGPPARHRRARVSPARRGRGEAALPDLRRRIREAVGGNHHEPGVQQVGVGVRGRPDGRRRDRPHRPPREARPVPRRVLPRPPCPHAGGLAAQKACSLPMLRLLNFRSSFCSNPLDETQPTSTFRRPTGGACAPTTCRRGPTGR